MAQRPRRQRLHGTSRRDVSAARRTGHGPGHRRFAGVCGRWRGGGGRTFPRQGQTGPRHARRRCPGLGRPPPVHVQRHRTLLQARLPQPPGSRMAAGAGRCGGKTQSRGQGRRRRLRAWRLDRDHGPGLPAVELHRVRLPRPFHRRGHATGRGRWRCRPRPLRQAFGQGLPGQRLRPDLLLRLPA
ncbi:hypothetical protein D3C84_746870 [compost metagenome]